MMKMTENGRAGGYFSLLVLLLAATGAWLNGAAGEFYYQLVQEDGPLEWATFWALLVAAGCWIRHLRRRTRRGWLGVCYLAGLGAGCLLLALEEISWGQRLIGFQPPELFLSDNFQQELNLHNFADAGFRKAAVLLLLAGYGIALPLLAALPALTAWLERHGVTAPALSFVPGFAVATLLYLAYPWHQTGEWVELFAGLGLLAAATGITPASPPASSGRWRLLLPALVLLLGVLTPRLLPEHADAAKIALAAAETDALARDFRHKRLRSRCGIHMRVYSFVEDYGARRMQDSAFVPRSDDAGEQRRIRYFLDPWQQPYWIRHHCVDGRSTVFVYSFGPDHRRQSSSTRIDGDDIGAYVSGLPDTGYQPLQRGQVALIAQPPSTTR